jgi:hypothetical protein
MKFINLNITLVLLLSSLFCNVNAQNDWTNKVRISGNPLSIDNVNSIIKNATDSYVFGIEVDNDIPGRYESFINPEEKLEAIRKVTEEAHKINNKTFVYIAGLECITAEADKKEHTFFKDHPDWVQRDINGKPAMFGGKDAFWIKEGDEDVWITPYAKEWRKTYMQRVREIAATGIDGIYVDIPYWMTHFEGWEKTWASFDDYTVATFKEQTGLNAKTDFELGNYDDPGFIKWINFRMQTLTDFMAEIDKNVKEVNPDCKTIAEIYPGLTQEAVIVGADVFQIYNVVDVIAHEYSEGEYYASDRAATDWYNYIIGMQTFRAFAGDKASWMLSYSWYDNEKVIPSDAMKDLFVSELFSGTNLWDVKGYVMSSTNDMETRTEVYKWVSEYEDIFYSKRIPVEPISVYFSDNSRNYFGDDYVDSYRGIMSLLFHSHLPFNVVTSWTVDKSSPKILILPDVKSISNEEVHSIKKLSENGTKFILTGECGDYNENRELQSENPLQKLFGFDDNSGKVPGNFIYIKDDPGKIYTEKINEYLNSYFNNDIRDDGKLSEVRNEFLSDLFQLTSYSPKIKIDAPIDLIATTNITDENIYVYLTNIRGICETCNSNAKMLKNIKVSYDNSIGSEDVYILPFLGKKQKIETVKKGDEISFVVPEIDRGAVLMINR